MQGGYRKLRNWNLVLFLRVEAKAGRDAISFYNWQKQRGAKELPSLCNYNGKNAQSIIRVTDLFTPAPWRAQHAGEHTTTSLRRAAAPHSLLLHKSAMLSQLLSTAFRLILSCVSRSPKLHK
jgi:hypothetical protein